MEKAAVKKALDICDKALDLYKGKCCVGASKSIALVIDTLYYDYLSMEDSGVITPLYEKLTSLPFEISPEMERLLNELREHAKLNGK